MNEKRSPFSLGELGSLQQARETDDLKYLMEWSKAAVKHHEKEKNRLVKELEALRQQVKAEDFEAFERVIQILSDDYIGKWGSEEWKKAREILGRHQFYLQKTWDHDD